MKLHLSLFSLENNARRFDMLPSRLIIGQLVFSWINLREHLLKKFLYTVLFLLNVIGLVFLVINILQDSCAANGFEIHLADLYILYALICMGNIVLLTVLLVHVFKLKR